MRHDCTPFIVNDIEKPAFLPQSLFSSVIVSSAQRQKIQGKGSGYRYDAFDNDTFPPMKCKGFPDNIKDIPLTTSHPKSIIL
jgi:hypothetical protein